MQVSTRSWSYYSVVGKVLVVPRPVLTATWDTDLGGLTVLWAGQDGTRYVADDIRLQIRGLVDADTALVAVLFGNGTIGLLPASKLVNYKPDFRCNYSIPVELWYLGSALPDEDIDYSCVDF